MSGLDFGALPPEINSGLMYTGSGSGPILSAATAWDGLAAELNFAAASYKELVSELTEGPWQGPSATAMAAAAGPYIEWMDRTAEQAAQTASQAKTAAAAYEAAYTATVPPPVVAANRALLAALVATNFFGQNTPAIAANQAEYAEMWAQDATAMYSYAGNTTAAIQLTPFTAAPQNTNPAGTSSAAAAADTAPAWAESLLTYLHNLGTTGWSKSIVDLFSTPLVQEYETFGQSIEGLLLGSAGFSFNGVSTIFIVAPGLEAALTQGVTATRFFNGTMAGAAAGSGLMSDVAVLPGGGLGPSLVGSYGPGFGGGGASVSAGLGRAASVGALSVPQSWAGAQEIQLAATALPAPNFAGLPGAGGLGAPPLPISMVDTGNSGSRSRYASRSKLISALPGGPGAADESLHRSEQPAAAGQDGGRALTDRERRERDELQEEIADLARHRDAVARLIKEAMRP